MRIGRISVILAGCIFLIMLTGCVSQEQYNDLRAQNRIQQERIAALESELSDSLVKVQQLQTQLDALQGTTGADIDAKTAEIAALMADIEKKKELIAKMQAQLMRGVAVLPDELNILLREFARDNPMVTFDENTGMLKFKSDLLFDLGSDNITAAAAESIKALCKIMNTDKAKEFDLLIVGHTDDVPIKKPATREKHPTNWHLSAHRAIAVLNAMTASGVAPQRVSVRGFGEYRPVEPNMAGQKGNPANRRVEIYVIPSGA